MKTLIRLYGCSQGISPVWSESYLSALRKLGSLATRWAQSENSDQTGRKLVYAYVCVCLRMFMCPSLLRLIPSKIYLLLTVPRRFFFCRSFILSVTAHCGFCAYEIRGLYFHFRCLRKAVLCERSFPRVSLPLFLDTFYQLLGEPC